MLLLNFSDQCGFITAHNDFETCQFQLKLAEGRLNGSNKTTKITVLNRVLAIWTSSTDTDQQINMSWTWEKNLQKAQQNDTVIGHQVEWLSPLEVKLYDEAFGIKTLYYM